jgi:MOSC domain-containing protein YiiM
MSIRIESVNIGHSRPLNLGNRTVSSAIRKGSVAGTVEVTVDGLVGDEQGDKVNHGGIDQAVYLYSSEDYAWWSSELDYVLSPATFGENLTLSSFGKGSVRVGDRFRIGGVLLEATGPRIPCSKLATMMGDPEFVLRFERAGRPGVYTRVLKPGLLEAGKTVERIVGSADALTVPELMRLCRVKKPAPEELRRALQAPLAARTRARFEQKLAGMGRVGD